MIFTCTYIKCNWYRSCSWQCLIDLIKIQRLANKDSKFVSKLITSDKTHFYLNIFVNKQNSQIWILQKPKNIHPHILHPLKCTVLCSVISERIIGPYSFQYEYGKAMTINRKHYQVMIKTFLHPSVQNKSEMWFQQDGVTAHTA